MKVTQPNPTQNSLASLAHNERLAASVISQQLKAAAAAQNWMGQLAQHAQWAITLQTAINSDSKDQQQLERKRELARQALQFLLPRLNQKLTGNGWRRKDEYKPLFVAAIQTGLHGRATYSAPAEYKTIHIHALLGNTQSKYDRRDIQRILGELWPLAEYGTADIDVRPLILGAKTGWGEYCAREWQTNGNLEPVDFTTAQVPPQIAAQVQTPSF